MRKIWIGIGMLLGLAIILVIAGLIAIWNIDWNDYKEPIADAARDATGRRLDLSGDLSLAIGLRPGIALNDVSFENAEWGSRSDMARIERLIVRLRLIPLLSGRVEIDRIELVGLDLLLETNGDGVANWEFEEIAEVEVAPEPDGEDGAATDEPLRALIRRLVVEDAQIVIRDHRADTEQSILIARLLAETQDATSPLVLDMRAKLDEEPIALRGELTGFSDALAGGALGLDLTLEAGGASSSVEGRIVPGPETTEFDFEIGIEGDELADWSGLAGSALPSLGHYRIGFQVVGGGTAFEVRSLEVEIGDTTLSGKLDVDLSGKRPRVVAELTSPLIDLADLQDAGAESPTPSAGVASREAPPNQGARVLPDDPLPLEGLTTVDATVSLEVKTLRTGSIDLSDVSVEIALESGKLRVDPLTLQIAGGATEIAVVLDASRKRPSLLLRGTANDIVIGDLSRSQGSEVLEGGSLDLRFDLRGRGGSVAEFAGSLDGTFLLEIGEAQVRNQWVGLALGEVQSIIAGRGDIGVAQINCVLADFVFKKGIGRPKILVLDLSSIALFGDGTLDLGRERIDLRFDREGKELSASQVLPPFQIGGTFANPKPAVDPIALARRALDLGTSLLAGEKLTTGRSWPEGCRAMHEVYTTKEEGETPSVQTTDSIRDAGRDAIKSLRGLFKR